ncbi:MAG: hypothetical protein ACE5GM_03160 [bacterium]
MAELDRENKLVLENDFLVVTFPGTKAGFDGVWLKNYASGTLQSTEYNNLASTGEVRLLRGDFHALAVGADEYYSGNQSWIAYGTAISSRDLYGSLDPYGDVEIEAVKVISSDNIDIGSDRQITGQEFTYYFTPDGKGLIKRVRLDVKKTGPQASLLQTVKFIDFNSFSPVGYKTACDYAGFTAWEDGFDYRDMTGFLADWSVDSGLNVSLARGSLYPNLLPAFGDSSWTAVAGSPVVVSGSRLDLAAGDKLYCQVLNAYPANRTLTLNLTVSNLSGALNLKFGTERNGRDIPVAGNTVSVDGTYTFRFTTGYGDNWLYLELEQTGGSCQITDPVVHYLYDGVSYVAPDGSYLANTNLKQCVRVTGSNPQGKRLTLNLSPTRKIAASSGVQLLVRSLDNTEITDGAFQLSFQKPDNSWVDSAMQNLLIDYNETLSGAQQVGFWEDGLFGVKIPDGLDEIKAVAIEFTTTASIDWLLDGFITLGWQKLAVDPGADRRYRVGPVAAGLRSENFSLRGVGLISDRQPSSVAGDRIQVVVVTGPGGYGETAALSFSDVSSVTGVYQLQESSLLTTFSDWDDRVYCAAYDLASVTGYAYPVKVENLTRGEEYTITGSSGTVCEVDISEKDYAFSDSLKITYVYKDWVSSANWSLATDSRGRTAIKWAYNAWTIANDRQAVYVDYPVSSRTDDRLSLCQGTSLHHCSTVRGYYYDPRVSSPLVSTYGNLIFSNPANDVAETALIYYPGAGLDDDALYQKAEEIQELADRLIVNNRSEPLTPAPRNYNLVPHVAFGGEAIAADPLEYLQEVNEKFYRSGVTNTIISGGSLAYLRDRDPQAWWWWGGSLRDNGIDLLSATRAMIRRSLSGGMVGDRLNRHRYLLELTTFAYDHNKRYRSHASVDYQGVEKFKRVWYYEADSGLYTTVVRQTDDFDDTYYDPVTINGDPYYFQYHYLLVIPAFWSITTPKTDWGISEETIYDLMARRIDYTTGHYDCDGVIISELIHYKEGFSDNDFSLYDSWCVTNGYGAQADWPRFGTGNYVDPDDSRVWGWKRYQMKKYITEMATIAHGNGKLLGINVNVQNIIPVANPDNPVWDGYTKGAAPYGGTCVDTLDYSCDRYGTNYDELLKEDIVDLLYVWLYYRYSAFGIQAVYDFAARFSAYKSRMLLTVGLFPKEDPPDAQEVTALVQDLLQDGWNVAYAGYPPMMIRDARWQNVWDNWIDYLPWVDYNREEGRIEVTPRKMGQIPFHVRF